MRKTIFILLILITAVLFFGCTAPEAEDGKLNVQVSENIAGSVNTSEWSAKVAALGTPTYEEVVIEPGYKILPFPGLTYNGLRDNYQAFYATNLDYTFAIYAVPAVLDTEQTFDEVKETIKAVYTPYTPTITCSNITTTGWLTNTQAFECHFYYTSIDADYKTVVFYKDGKYVQTILGVWGTSLSEYEYIFDEFNQKAVSWK